MQEIPIFPLNVVVFPGMLMPLHIFEERYKVMINECVEEKRPFGIILIEEGKPEGDKNVVPRHIGCTVQISEVEQLEDGRMIIMTYGKDRFRLRKLDREKRPFLTGTVEYLNLVNEPVGEDDRLADLRELVIEYLVYLQKNDDFRIDVAQIPEETEALIYVSASLLNVENNKKQSLLESNDLNNILNYLLSAYRKEVNLLRMMPKNDTGVFSVN